MTNSVYKRKNGHNKFRAWIGLRGKGLTEAKLAVPFDMDAYDDWNRQIKECQAEVLKELAKASGRLPRNACKIGFRPDAYVILGP